jgi:hypothetical protein
MKIPFSQIGHTNSRIRFKIKGKIFLQKKNVLTEQKKKILACKKLAFKLAG